jgi:hypothetical protein
MLTARSVSGLVAYPGQPPTIGATIAAALDKLGKTSSALSLTTWEENDIAGRFLIGPVLSSIDAGSVLVADVTHLNFNVTFEIGYAIGKRKRVYLIRDTSINPEDTLTREVGIFDTLGYEGYSNSLELVHTLERLRDFSPIPIPGTINLRAPVYLVLPRSKTDVEIHAIARVKKARLQFRTFDPEELGRLPAREAIDSVAQSFGILTVLIQSERIDARVHNLRTAFVAGLASGLNKEILILQPGDEPVPLDFRELVKPVRHPDHIDEHVANFAAAVGACFQTTSTPASDEPHTVLEKLSLGASSAENELQDLGAYYLETDEFRRACRGEVRIVVGLKGAGKTALFAQLRDRLRQQRNRVILDLKPEGFQLLKFKERVLDYLEEGTRAHTITAFWEYLLLLEICHKILDIDRQFYLRNHDLFDIYNRLAERYYEDDYISEGDFAERMLKLTQRIADDFGATGDTARNRVLSTGQITELLYKHDVGRLRQDLIAYLNKKGPVWILFDNLDKGWHPRGVTSEDVTTLRCLIEAMGKVERELSKSSIECHGVVFIRNDVYEFLIRDMADRGKVASITLDWTDASLLRELLRRRFVHGSTDTESSFDEIWRHISTTHIRGEETSQYLIDRSLMRPRALIDLLRGCRSHAVNLGHPIMTVEDIDAGEAAYSSEVLVNMSFEIGDVFPSATNVLYEFLESTREVEGTKVRDALRKNCGDEWQRVLELLLWYGFLGLTREDGEVTYIYMVRYDMSRMKALVEKRGVAASHFTINPAFWKALEVH